MARKDDSGAAEALEQDSDTDGAGEDEKPAKRSKVSKVVVTATRSQAPDNFQDDAAMAEWGVSTEGAHLLIHPKSDGTVETRVLSAPRGGTLKAVLVGHYEPGLTWSRSWGAAEKDALQGALDSLGIALDQVQLETENIYVPEEGHRFSSEDGTYEVVEVPPVQEKDDPNSPAPEVDDPPVTAPQPAAVMVEGSFGPPPEGSKP